MRRAILVVSAIAQLKELLGKGCKVSRVQPAMFASDVEVNIVVVTVSCPDGMTQIVKAYREQAHELREFVRSLQL